jgi:hypothetical protein
MKSRLFCIMLIATLIPGADPALAQSSCSGFLDKCVARGKRDRPDDRSYKADHCDPKFRECQASGCWQEGQRYGGALTCKLTKK